MNKMKFDDFLLYHATVWDCQEKGKNKMGIFDIALRLSPVYQKMMNCLEHEAYIRVALFEDLYERARKRIVRRYICIRKAICSLDEVLYLGN